MNHLQRVLSPTDTDGSSGDFHQDSDLDAILDATELDIRGQSCTTNSKDVSGLSNNDHSESVVDSRFKNSQS